MSPGEQRGGGGAGGGADDDGRAGCHDRVAGRAVADRHVAGEGEHAGDAAGCGGQVRAVGGDADEAVDADAHREGECGRAADGRGHAVHEGGREAADIVHGECGAGCPERGADAGVAAEIGREKGVAGEFVEAASGLLAVGVGVVHELADDADAAGDHVEVGGGRVVIDRQRVLLDAPARGNEAVVEVGVRRGGERRDHGWFQASARLGECLADADGDVLAIGDGAVAEARRECRLELAVEEALLDDRLEGGGEVGDTHVRFLFGSGQKRRRSSSARAARYSEAVICIAVF